MGQANMDPESTNMSISEFINTNQHESLVNSKSQHFPVPGELGAQSSKVLSAARRVPTGRQLMNKIITTNSKVVQFTQLKLNS